MTTIFFIHEVLGIGLTVDFHDDLDSLLVICINQTAKPHIYCLADSELSSSVPWTHWVDELISIYCVLYDYSKKGAHVFWAGVEKSAT